MYGEHKPVPTRLKRPSPTRNHSFLFLDLRACNDSRVDTLFTLLCLTGTEKAVGEAIKESGIPREELFVTTKLP